MKTWITLLVIAGVVVVLGVATGSDPESKASPEAVVETEAAVARPAILDFGRGQCIPCIKMMPVLDALREKYQGVVDVTYVDMDADGSDLLIERHEITLIPTQVFLDAEGEELWRHQGFIPLDQIEGKLREFGWIPSR